MSQEIVAVNGARASEQCKRVSENLVTLHPDVYTSIVFKYMEAFECLEAGCENSEAWKRQAETNYNAWKPHFKQLNNFAFEDVLYSFFCEMPAMEMNNKGFRCNNDHLYSMRTPNHKGKSVDQYLVPIVARSKRDSRKAAAYLKTEVFVVVMMRSVQYFMEQSSMGDKLFFVHLCAHANCFSPLHLAYEKVEITAARTACQQNLDSCDHRPACINLANQGEPMVFQVKEITVAKSKKK